MTFWLDKDVPEQIREDARFEGTGPNGEHPFVVDQILETFTDPETGRPYGTALFNCSALRADGRCGIYENRPQLCRAYEPGSDHLCVHYRGAEAGDSTIPLGE